MSAVSQTTGEVCAKELLGRVKWFNNKAGYGFITVSDGDYKEKDIFSHFSAILVTNSQYKYLVQGEYVQFDLAKSSEGGHEFKAINITGVKGGELMCETRNHIHTERKGARGDGKKRQSNTDAQGEQ